MSVWQWAGDFENQWFNYEEMVCRRLDNACSSGKRMCTLPSDSLSAGHVVDLLTMEVCDDLSVTRRPVQHLVVDKTVIHGTPCWQWGGDARVKSEWNEYDADSSRLLETSFKGRSQPLCNLSAGIEALPYVVDVDKMIQTNTRTGFRRRVQRLIKVLPKDVVEMGAARSSTGLATGGQVALPTPNGAGALGSGMLSKRAAGTSSSPFAASHKCSEDSVNSHHTLDKELEPLKSFVEAIGPVTSNDACAICLDELCAVSGYSVAAGGSPSKSLRGAPVPLPGSDDTAVVRLSECKHQFHQMCLLSLFRSRHASKDVASITCPSCNKIYGQKTGVSPLGRMEHVKLPRQSLPGYESCGTICVTYHIAPGVQGPEHPHPGLPYLTPGFPRSAYLPDNARGRLVLQLLEVAWRRRLTFTVGQSVTTGAGGVVTWNEIHHKTSLSGQYGYPDPGYLDRVTHELEAMGVSAKEL